MSYNMEREASHIHSAAIDLHDRLTELLSQCELDAAVDAIEWAQCYLDDAMSQMRIVMEAYAE